MQKAEKIAYPLKIESGLKEKLNILSELTKIRITIFVTLTTAFGFIVEEGTVTNAIVLPVLGILLLACGSAVINHVQEYKTDALMRRTKNRPIPSGKVSPSQAILLAVVLSLAGSILLYIGANLIALVLGLLNLVWYNGIYTLLKKKSPLAIVPGSLVGAIPPAVGWVAAGGSIFDPQILVISFFFFMWQIPHFWLLLLVLDEDYKRAGFPTLTEIFSKEQLARITFVWIVATSVTSLLLPFFGIVNSIISFGLFIAGAWLIYNSFKLIRLKEQLNFRFAFHAVNAFALFVVFLVSIDHLLIR